MAAVAPEKNLLFGLLALQNGLIGEAQLVAAFRGWMRDKARPLVDHLATLGFLDAEGRAAVEALAALHLKRHNGDVEKSLASLSAGESTRESLVSLGDPDLETTLGFVGSGLGTTDSGQTDADRTAPYSVGSATSNGQRFRVLRPHARGGLGAVFVALDSELNREVALKQILDDHADDPISRARFLVEAEITGGLEHPGIVPVYGLGSFRDGRPYYAMRFIKGESLKRAIDRFHADASLRHNPGRRSLELRQLLRRFVDVCNAIDYAHSRGVLHRDIKPSNVIVGLHGETLVVDWGLAKALGRVETGPATGERSLVPSSASGYAETMPGSALGTPSYMSPEQAAGDLDRLGPWSDVASLGATLYCLLTGRPPFEGDDIGAVLRHVRRGGFAPPRQVDPAIDPALEAVCLKAMANRPEDRYSSCRALADDVERWAADEPVSAWREPFSVRARRWMRRHRTAVALAGAILISAVVALIAGLVVVNQERRRTAGQRDRAERALIEVRREKERADRALIAETRARQRARAVLDDTTSEVVEKFLATGGTKLGPDQEAFLKKVLASYREFAAETGSSEETRAAVAKAHGRVGTMLYKMGQPQDAQASWRRAAELYGLLIADYPDRANYRTDLAGSRHNVAVVDLEAGRTREAERALRENLEIQQRLAAEDPADPLLGQHLARTLSVLGNVLNRLGRVREAGESYRSAEEVLRRAVASPSAQPAARAALSALLISRALHLWHTGQVSEAEALFREAVTIDQRLTSDAPLEVKYRSELAVAQGRLAAFLADIGRTDEADAAFREALAIGRQLAAEFPTIARHRSDLVETYDHYAIFCAGAGRHKEAEAAFRDGLALNRQLAADFPTVPRYRSDLATSLTNLGVTYTITGRSAEAEAAYREAIAIKRRLASEFPDAPRYQSDLGRSLFNLAIVLVDKDAKEEALRESIAVLRPAAARASGAIDDRFLLAKSLKALGDVVDHARRGAEAEALIREAVRLDDGVVAEAPKVTLYREERAVSQISLGAVLKELGRTPEAESAFREAVAGFEGLVADVPSNPHYGGELAAVEGDLADLLAERGEFAAAFGWLGRAAPRIDAALKANPDRPEYKRDLRRNRLIQVRCRAGLGDPAAAIALAESIGRLGFDPAADTYASACALAQCVPATGREDPWRFAERAMDALRRAVAAGFRDAARARTDRELDPLRDRPDFRLWMLDLAFPAEPFATVC
jgi:serine/threonine-protein kinase